MPELVLKLGDSVLQNYVFDKDVMSIGRSRDNDIVVENLSVSRNHARIRLQNGKYILTDLNSANGTYVNGVRVSKTEIVNEDVVSIGKHKLHFTNKPVGDDEAIVQTFGADRTVIVDRTPVASLCVLEGRLKGEEYPLAKFETSIGKATTNDVVLSDDWFLAKKQAVVVKRGNNEFELYDSGGIRKTKINGNAINKPTILKPGDVIEFGSVKCVFQWSGDEEIPGGRVPMELSAEDSIYATGVRYAEEVGLASGTGEENESQEAAASEEQEPEVAEAEPHHGSQNGTAPEDPDVVRLDFEMPEEPEHESQEMAADDTQKSRVFSAASEDSSDTAEQDADVDADDDDSDESDEENSAEVVAVSSLGERKSDGGPGESRSSRKRRRQQERRNRQAAMRQQSGPDRMNDNPGPIEGTSVPVPADVSPEEIELWEAALSNRSPVIRRQAARMLKKLTGRDYEV